MDEKLDNIKKLDKDIFAARFGIIREETGINMVDIANAIGISKPSVHQWATGLNMPLADKLFELAEILDCSLDYLTGRTDNQYSHKQGGEILTLSNGSIVKLIHYEENQDMKLINENARNHLKKLTALFRRLHNALLHKTEVDFGETVKAKLEQLGVTPSDLYEWSVSNFQNPPAEKQLKGLILFCKESTNRKLIQSSEEEIGFETAANDYWYYMQMDEDKTDEDKSGENMAVPKSRKNTTKIGTE